MNQPTDICKHCGLTLQGTEQENEDICVSCLIDLCFEPTKGYSSIEGCIRQTTDNPINKTDNNNERRKPIQHTKRTTEQRDTKD